jgi:hypothetical protein
LREKKKRKKKKEKYGYFIYGGTMEESLNSKGKSFFFRGSEKQVTFVFSKKIKIAMK